MQRIRDAIIGSGCVFRMSRAGMRYTHKPVRVKAKDGLAGQRTPTGQIKADADMAKEYQDYRNQLG